MRYSLLVMLCCGLVLGDGRFGALRSAAARPRLLSTRPAPLILGESGEAELLVRLPGVWPADLQAAVNIGTLGRIERRGSQLSLRYRLPEKRFPQELALVLFSAKAPRRSMALRLALLARTQVEVRTRPRSTVHLRVAGRTYGPFSSGSSGALHVPVVVPPAVGSAAVDVVDDKGMRSHKVIPIVQPPYTRFAALATQTGPASDPHFAIVIGPIRAKGPLPKLVLVHEETQLRIELKAQRLRRGLATVGWAPSAAIPRGSWRLHALDPALAATGATGLHLVLAGAKPASAPKVIITPKEVPTSRPLAPPKPAPRAAPPAPSKLGSTPEPSRLAFDASLSAGLMHNFAALTMPRIAAALGLHYRYGHQRFGVELGIGIAWSSGAETLALAAAGTDPIQAQVSYGLTLAPLHALLSYGYRLGRFALYGAAGPVLQLVHSTSDSALSGSEASTDLALGALGRLRGELRLGPGGLLLGLGYQACRLDAAVQGQLGGLFVETGYRLGF